jgi:AmiR/NasT family two-component response regulator
MYRSVAGGLSRVQWRDACSAADIAVLMMLGRRTDPADLDSHVVAGRSLDHPLGSRAEIHQATGMVLAQLEVSGTEALARLRGYAFVEQRTLIDVARDVVARRLVFSEEMK